MNYKVFITSKAKLQLVTCARWWFEHRDPTQSVRWLEGMENAIDSLRENPAQHSLSRENNLYELPYPVRQLLYGIGSKPTHRAVFEIRNDTVYVVAVRHLAQDDLSSTEL